MASTTGYGSADANAKRIVAAGLRNPFRFAIRPDTDEVWVGDVGWGKWEEIDRIADPGGSLENFGWPCYEGSSRHPDYDVLGLDICKSLYSQPGSEATQRRPASPRFRRPSIDESAR